MRRAPFPPTRLYALLQGIYPFPRSTVQRVILKGRSAGISTMHHLWPICLTLQEGWR